MFTLVLETVDMFFTSKHNFFMFPPFFSLLLGMVFDVKGKDLCHFCLCMPIGALIAIGESPVHFHDERFMN